MSERRFIYFADPMCSWCWGFSPIITKVVENYCQDIRIDPLMGGLRAGNTEVLDEKGKDYIRGHWEHVHKASGQNFDFSFFERDDFIYDTEPACRAVVTMRRMSPEHSMAYLARVHQAFYAEGKDVTKGEVLVALAAALGVDEEAFAREFESDDAKSETQGDFAITHQAQVPGFPTLVAGTGDTALQAITTGYQPWENIERGIETWLASAEDSPAGNSL